MIELWRNAAVLGAMALGASVVGASRGWRWTPAAVLCVVGAAFALRVLSPAWVVESLLADAPWMAAAVLAVWSLNAGAGWLRPRAWPLVVLTAAVFGDRFVALGLAAVEPDPSRRARLVLAASGASFIGPAAGAAPLILGHMGVQAVGVGILLALVGFTRGGGDLGARSPDLRGALEGLVLPLCGALITWLAMAGGALEFAATGLEWLPNYWIPRGDLVAFAAAAFAGAIGDEGMLALCFREVQLRALSLRGDEIPLALNAGLAVGGGLPLLLLTRARLSVGLPLWLAQVGVVATWLYLR
jgi:hypothetical protein